ncbi:phosphatidylglycerol lysyltransferase domain-containing protein [bacterium]|nr:phosphatidylglycerol lysyltransferase domain-containing protein [bacterium]
MDELKSLNRRLLIIIPRSIAVKVAALITLGSGLVNLNSVIGPGLPERMALLRNVFPLEFLNLSRFLTVLIGFALVISSINIYNRKKRAFKGVLTLAILSIVFHMSKSLDYEEALFSLFLAVMLFLSRKEFTVKSSTPDIQTGVIRVSISLLIALAYGITGFWFLDRSQFGINFTISNSIRETLLFFSLQGDPGIVPHTHHAQWFLDSLYLVTVTALVYSLFTLFRPVIYIFRILPGERELARQIVTNHGRSSLDYYKFWPDKSFFFSQTQQTFIAYRVGGNYALALGDPVGPEDEIEGIIRDFAEFCQENGWGIGFHQTIPDFLPVYNRLGFRNLKIGDDAIIDLNQFTLEGREKKKIRQKLNQLEESGIHTVHYDPPIPKIILAELKDISDDWLKIPGRRERGFTLGKFEQYYVQSTPVFAAADRDGKLLGYINIIPSYRKGEVTADLMRHRIDAPNGIMDFIFVSYFGYLREKGAERFNLGMAPMSGFQENEDASLEERSIHFFFQNLNFLFSFRGLKQYKAKYATSWEPRYLIYKNTLDLPRLALAIGKVSELKET